MEERSEQFENFLEKMVGDAKKKYDNYYSQLIKEANILLKEGGAKKFYSQCPI